VQIGEVRVAAGDLVVADDTGVCFIPRDVVLEVLDATEQKAKAEAVRCKAIDDGVPVRAPMGRSRRIEANLKLYVRPNDARRTRRLGQQSHMGLDR
jgi:hypothetical protein